MGLGFNESLMNTHSYNYYHLQYHNYCFHYILANAGLQPYHVASRFRLIPSDAIPSYISVAVATQWTFCCNRGLSC
jgi:hypothetical protein